MPGIARKAGTDSVDTVHGATGGNRCNAAPTTTSTDAGSSNVLVNGIGVVREDDVVTAHNDGSSCVTHTPKLASFSSTVKVNGKGVGRLNDTYSCGAKITSASGNVIAN